MKLWTIQSIDFYKSLCSEKVIYSSETCIPPDFKQAYDWMNTQMDYRIGKRPFKNSYPVWAWFQYESCKTKRPDLRNTSLLQKGTHGVRIEIEKSNEEVLLSDFILWHYVLNFWYISGNKKEENEFEKILKKNNIKSIDKNNCPPEIRKRVENSWNKIFDLRFNSDSTAKKMDEKSIQATFWSLKREDITKVDFFIAR